MRHETKTKQSERQSTMNIHAFELEEATGNPQQNYAYVCRRARLEQLHRVILSIDRNGFCLLSDGDFSDETRLRETAAHLILQALGDGAMPETFGPALGDYEYPGWFHVRCPDGTVMAIGTANQILSADVWSSIDDEGNTSGLIRSVDYHGEMTIADVGRWIRALRDTK